MYKFRSVWFPFGLLMLIVALIWLYQRDEALNVVAYPPPTPYVSLSGYPAPTGTPIAPTPDFGQITLADEIYLPSVYRPDALAHFSIAGGFSREMVAQVVPNGLEIDPYVWDRLPNTKSSIQMVRSCLYYRNKYWDEGNLVFWETWYWPNRVGKLCWDPVTEQIGKIVNHPDCPFYDSDPDIVRPCLDLEVTSIPNTGEADFRDLLRNQGIDNIRYAEQIWLVGNETDNAPQDALLDEVYITPDGENTYAINLGPTSYARFYKYIYDLVDEVLQEEASNQTPKLVFCQATYARGDRVGLGLDYCRDAFAVLKDDLGYGTDHIYALATHEYLHEQEIFGINNIPYENGELLDGETLIDGEPYTPIERALIQWEGYLQEFEAWAEFEGMGDKPLWLTEYGSLAARCFEVHPIPAPTPVPDSPASFRCMGIEGNNIFYGRADNEGIWGLQMGQFNYLMQPDNQWEAAWWFGSIIADTNSDGICDQTVWIWGQNNDCTEWRDGQGNYILSRAGETHRQALDCLYYARNCHVISNPYIIDLPAPVSLPAEELSCKAREQMLCLPPMPPPPIFETPTPTTIPPTPTLTSTNCNCIGFQCPQVICYDE